MEIDKVRDIVDRCKEVLKNVLQWGWIPMIVGLGYWRSPSPRPSIFRIINPLG